MTYTIDHPPWFRTDIVLRVFGLAKLAEDFALYDLANSEHINLGLARGCTAKHLIRKKSVKGPGIGNTYEYLKK